MQYLIGLLGIFGAGFLFYFFKNQSAQALLSILSSKAKVQDLQGDITKNQALDQVEEEKRKQIESSVETAKNEQISKDDLSDFFNRKP